MINLPWVDGVPEHHQLLDCKLPKGMDIFSKLIVNDTVLCMNQVQDPDWKRPLPFLPVIAAIVCEAGTVFLIYLLSRAPFLLFK